MKDGVTSDGIWWEGAWGYHFYTISALSSLTEAARNCGIDLYCDEVKRMYDAPFMFAMPNGNLPAFSDSNEFSFSKTGPTYEQAYARFANPDYVPLIARSNRRNPNALWFGEGDLPENSSTECSSRNYPEAGYGILSKGRGEDATWLCLKYGAHGSGHGHPDKLSFILAARGETIGVDPGTARYGLPIQRAWYRKTIAHNTLSVDERSQQSATGKCLAFGQEHGVDYVMAEAGDIYDGVRFVRTVAMLNENLIVFVDQIRSASEHTYDVAYHQLGSWVKLPEGSAWEGPKGTGYEHLENATIREASGSETLKVKVKEKWQVAITLADNEPTEIITGGGIQAYKQERVPAAIFRRRTKDAAFVWALSLDGVAPKIQTRSLLNEEGEQVTDTVWSLSTVSEATGGTWEIETNADAGTVTIRQKVRV